MAGAAALVIRSATQVTAEVLAAGSDLVVVGRAGIGLDNVDVAEATRRGVMVVNAPQSNILSAAEHTLALLLSQARNVPQANADLRGREVEPVAVGGRRAARQDARHRRARPRRCARRAARARVRHAARRVRPVRERRAGAPDRRAARHHDRGAVRDVRLRHDPRDRRRPQTIGLVNADPCSRRPSPGCGSSTPGGAASSTRTRSPPRFATGSSRGAAIDMFATEPTTESPLFALDSVVVTPHLGASTVRSAGQGRRHDRRAGRARAARRLRAVRGQRRRDGGVRDRAAVPAARGAARPAVHRPGRRRRPKRSRSPTRARSPTTTAACSRSRCSRACSARSSTSR